MKLISAAFVVVVAAICFAGAAVIQREPEVRPAAIPEAADVRAAVNFAEVVQMLLNSQEPVSFVLQGAWLEGVHRLVGHAKDKLAMDGRIDPHGATFRVSKRLMRHGWLNLAFRLENTHGDGPPSLSLYAGGRRAPDMVTNLLLRAGLPLLGDRHTSLGDLIPSFRTEGDSVNMTARLPKELVGGLQAILSPGGGAKVDMAMVRSIYGDLLHYVIIHPDHDYPLIIRHAAMRIQDQEGLKAAVVALTMLVDGPRVRRLAGEKTSTPPCPLMAQDVYLQGRSDSPKHWTMSAALALFMGQKTARAVGLWKELDDSLPVGDGVTGGTGFSFVDLAADTAGIRLGLMARNGGRMDAALAALRTGENEIILPRAALRLPEGVSLGEFKRRYGGLEYPAMLEAEEGMDKILRQSPLYRELPPSKF